MARGSSPRFQYGYWHLEPLVAVFRDSILVVACIYAAVDGLITLTSGGQEVEYGLGAFWAGILCIVGSFMTVFLHRRAAALRSPMFRLDARSWMVSACLSLALLIGFAIAVLLERTNLRPWVPYLDAIALLAMALLMLPLPLIGLVRSMRDVLQVAPNELDKKVHAIMDSLVKEQGFVDYTSYIAKVGRVRFVEIHVLVPPDSSLNMASADAMRRDIAARLDANLPSYWLTIDFTADRAWL
jgi:predicted Co/Zn/Cd cation transporter (cation efflux family)